MSAPLSRAGSYLRCLPRRPCRVQQRNSEYLCEVTAIQSHAEAGRSSLDVAVRCAPVDVHDAGRLSVERAGALIVVIFAEDTGPFNACNEACFWHCTLPDGTRKAKPSQPSRVPHGAVDQDGAGVPCCKPAGNKMRFSGLPRVGSTLPARRRWPFVFKPSARLDVVFLSSPPPSPSSLHILLTTVEHGVLD